MRKTLTALAIAASALLITPAVAHADTPAPVSTTKLPHGEQADGCDHGSTGKPCKDDPQPTRGQDCVTHGNHGGVNEDHCESTTSSSSTTATSSTSSTSSTTTHTTSGTSTTSTTSAPPILGLGGYDVDCTATGTRLTLWAYDTSDSPTWSWRIVTADGAETGLDVPSAPLERVFDVARGDSLRFDVQQLVDGTWWSLMGPVDVKADSCKLRTSTTSTTTSSTAPTSTTDEPVVDATRPASSVPELAATGSDALWWGLAALTLITLGLLLIAAGNKSRGKHQ